MRDDLDLDAILNEFMDPAPAEPAANRPPKKESPHPEKPAESPRRETAPTSLRRTETERPSESSRRRPTEMKERLPDVKAAFASCGERIHGLRERAAALLPKDWTPPRWFPVAINVLLLVLSLFCLRWTLFNVHPGSGTVVSSKPSVNLAGRMDPRAAQSGEIEEADPEGPDAEPGEEPAAARIRYVIDEGAVVAPAPNPACFGKISIAEPEKTLEVIQQARDFGLLREDETVIFDPNVTFYYDEDIEYYLDETILVICWKEVIDGNTCSFVEIKIADASQFRRKFADDTFAAPNQYYSTEMHKGTNAVVTLNADFYQNRDFGVVVYDRTLYRFPTSTYTGSYKKYNCLETCFVDEEGDFLFTELGQTFTEAELQQYIRDNRILFSLSFGPVLVQDGQVRQCDWYPVGEINKGYSRAGIGQVDKLHYLYMSLNHSPEREARWTVNTFAQHFGEKAVQNAYCLDGGQTGEIVFQGRAYNHVDVVNGQKERPVSDNIYFATAIGGTEVYE